MQPRTIIWICVGVGSTIGGAVPILWGGNMLSISSIVLTAVGGFAGLWFGYKLSGY